MDICCCQELWLHEYVVDVLDNLHSDFLHFYILPPSDDDVVFCGPRIQRGNGGVSILWRKTLPNVKKLYLPFPPTGVQLFPLIMITAFALCTCLPDPAALTTLSRRWTRSLCVIVDKFSGRAFFLGDFNADPGNSLGGFSTTSQNEQG